MDRNTLRFVKFIAVIFAFCILSLHSIAQSPSQYDKDFFRNPLDIPISLSANFGELRSNHWHMGLDIRTNRVENQKVYAAADGYIARVGVQSFGFGRVIYINHPNGLTTVYGHLNDFMPALQDYLKAYQYKTASWEQDIKFDSSQFPVTKGTLIAYSGNTGGSQGPHLHFEIRETKTEKCINPLFFNFPVSDNIPPSISKLALYDRSRSVYEQSPQFISIHANKGGNYSTNAKKITTTNNKLSFAIAAVDRSGSSASPNGIYSAKVCVDDEPISEFILDKIGYDQTLYMNAHIDYRYKYNGGSYLQHISKLPGDNGPVYHSFKNNGIIELTDTAEHKITIDVADVAGNVSTLEFLIAYQFPTTLDDARSSGLAIAPGVPTIIKKENFEANIPEGCVYDTIHPYVGVTNKNEPGSISALFQLHDPSTPVQEKFVVRIKPLAPVSPLLKEKVLIKNTYGKSISWRKGSWESDWITAKPGNFGFYQAFIDTTPPTINDIGRGDTINLSRSSRIVLIPKDNIEVASLRAMIDGNWLRFTNDKGRNYIYSFDEKWPFGTSEFKVEVTDLAGNSTIKSWWVKRSTTSSSPSKAVTKKATTNKKSTTAPAKKKVITTTKKKN